MKRKASARTSDRVTSGEGLRGNEGACLEIRSFLKALDTYAERFARKPGISFEQHHGASMPVKRNEPRRTMRQNCDARKD